MTDNVVPFASRAKPEAGLLISERVLDQREAERLKRIDYAFLSTNGLDAALGTPAEWLVTALLHLKVKTSGQPRGTVEVSAAAIHLLIMRLEELEHGGEPWRGGAA